MGELTQKPTVFFLFFADSQYSQEVGWMDGQMNGWIGWIHGLSILQQVQTEDNPKLLALAKAGLGMLAKAKTGTGETGWLELEAVSSHQSSLEAV